MKLIKQRLHEIGVEAKYELCSTSVKLMNGDITAFSKSDRIVACIAVIIAALLFAIAPVYGAGDIIDQISSQISIYYGKIVGIATAVAAFCILIALLWTLISPTSHGAQTPISWIKKILVCWILILCIGGIVTLIKNITSGMGYTPGN